MTERNQDGYQALGWILNHAEQGFFLVVAEEELQNEILSVYREGPVAVYDYREHPGPYSFQGFSAWLAGQEDVQTVFLANLQLAVQTEEDVKRLNFSRDMLARLEKNLIFLTTPYGDDLLATGAYDFYSFLKLRSLVSPQPLEDLVQKRLAPPCPTAPTEERWTPEETRRRLRDTDSLLEQAKKAVNQELEALLLQTLDLRERRVGPGREGRGGAGGGGRAGRGFGQGIHPAGTVPGGRNLVQAGSGHRKKGVGGGPPQHRKLL